MKNENNQLKFKINLNIEHWTFIFIDHIYCYTILFVKLLKHLHGCVAY